MALPESLTYLLLVVLGYALTRLVDLGCAFAQGRLRAASPGAVPTAAMSGTARQRLMERQAVYRKFRESVIQAIEAAVNQGHGSYGMLYQIRDDYADLLRHSPSSVSAAADSIIRCVTLLVNLGTSDQRYAMFTRALAHFDDECRRDEGLVFVPPGPRRQEFSVLGEAPGPSADTTSEALDQR